MSLADDPSETLRVTWRAVPLLLARVVDAPLLDDAEVRKNGVSHQEWLPSQRVSLPSCVLLDGAERDALRGRWRADREQRRGADPDGDGAEAGADLEAADLEELEGPLSPAQSEVHTRGDGYAGWPFVESVCLCSVGNDV